ncbi:g13479 [Coccomyxa viridis]|uniref:G13479 protein n=1 Tax=Coccomyxa viridis TaxID=1274662 RepID=A0ABP1GHJ4_9CHLO
MAICVCQLGSEIKNPSKDAFMRMLKQTVDALQEEDAEGSMLRALRCVFAAQSVTTEVVSSIMDKVDSNKDGAVDLRELTTALSKWLALIAYPGSRDLIHPFATARDIALDFYIAMKQDPRRGLGPGGLQSVLQALCLTARSSYDVIEDWVEATLLLPDPRLSEADTLAALEIDAAMRAKGPELMSGLLQRRKLAMVFRLWDPQARGCVNRAAMAAVLEFYYRSIVKAAKEKLPEENNAGAGLDIPFESQEARAPESFRDADPGSHSGKQSTSQEADTDTDEGASGEQNPDPAASKSDQVGPAEQQQEPPPEDSSGTEEHDKQADGAAEEDQVIAFLEEEMRKNPPRLDFKGFQALVYEFLLEAALHGAIYTGPDPEETIAYLRDQAEDALET